MTLTLTPPQRDTLWRLAADDLAMIGDTVHQAGEQRDLSDVWDLASSIRALLDFLDAIGWGASAPLDEYQVPLATEELDDLLRRWRNQLDGVLRDQLRDETEARAQIDFDNATRATVDGVLDAVAA